MLKTFQESILSFAGYLWSSNGNWVDGNAVASGDSVSIVASSVLGSDFQIDDLSNATLNSLSLSATIASNEQLFVNGNLTVGTLNLASVGNKPSILTAGFTSLTAPKNTVTIGAITGSGTLTADGANIIDNAATNTANMTYQVSRSGTVSLKNAPDGTSTLSFLDASGTFALSNLQPTTYTSIKGLQAGTSIEVPGTRLISANLGAAGSGAFPGTRLLTITTDAGSFAFVAVQTQNLALAGMTATSDNGLMRITFSSGANVTGLSISAGSHVSNGSGHIGIGGQLTFSVYTSASVDTLYAGVNPTSLTLSNGAKAVQSSVSAGVITYTYTVAAQQTTNNLTVTGFNGTVHDDTFSNAIDMSGVTHFGFGPISVGATVSHDFSNDGKSDVLLRNAAGVTYLWSMNGTSVLSAATTSVQVGTNWQISGIGDFDGDGKTDLLWTYNNASNASDALNGVSYISFQSGATATSGNVVQQLSGAWKVAGIGDFNADGNSDVLYRNTTTGQTYLDIMNGASVSASSGFTSQQVTNPNWSVAAVADFDGDGKSDVLWRYHNASNATDPLNGALYEWKMNGSSVVSSALLTQQAGDAWQVAGTGDFDGDGRSDILFRYENAANASDPLNGVTYIDFMAGTIVSKGAPTQWQVDNSWVVASIGDFNGDGKSDILWQQGSTGNTFVWSMNGATVTAGAFTSQQAGPGWTVQNGPLVG